MKCYNDKHIFSSAIDWVEIKCFCHRSVVIHDHLLQWGKVDLWFCLDRNEQDEGQTTVERHQEPDRLLAAQTLGADRIPMLRLQTSGPQREGDGRRRRGNPQTDPK